MSEIPPLGPASIPDRIRHAEGAWSPGVGAGTQPDARGRQGVDLMWGALHQPLTMVPGSWRQARILWGAIGAGWPYTILELRGAPVPRFAQVLGDGAGLCVVEISDDEGWADRVYDPHTVGGGGLVQMPESCRYFEPVVRRDELVTLEEAWAIAYMHLRYLDLPDGYEVREAP